jgi:D-alanine-D-alanine ligase
MTARLKVALLFGGRSAEHEVSLRSAASVFEAMDKDKYEVLPILITDSGAWLARPAHISSFDPAASLTDSRRLIFSPDPADKGFLAVSGTSLEPQATDVVFPCLHGTYGEDGTLQGLLDLANVPYVGCGVLASSLGMDKALMKSAFLQYGLNVGPYFWFLRREWENNRSRILERLNNSVFPVFVKPANLGSSVGITKVKDFAGFEPAVNTALSFDRKVLVEDGIQGRELEVSVLGNDNPKASLAGEVIASGDFYDYEEKYIRDTTELVIPAKLPADLCKRAQDAAIGAFKAVDGSGLARVDMFLTARSKFIVNEINTLPGFTSISMYPKLWEVTGLPYGALIDQLIALGLERHQEKQSIKTVRK